MKLLHDNKLPKTHELYLICRDGSVTAKSGGINGSGLRQ